MKIKNVNEDKHLLNFTVELEEDDIRRMFNTLLIQEQARFLPKYHFYISKEELNHLYPQESLDRIGMEQIAPVFHNYISDNIGKEVIFLPVITDINRDGELIDLEMFSATKPDSFLSENLDIEIEPFENKIEESEIVERLEELRNINARLVPSEKAVEDGNTLMVNIKVVNNEGEVISEDYNKIIPSETLHSTYNFEDFEGKNIEEIITYPTPNGKMEILINQIYNPELPELDDDFAAEVSEFDTLDEFKEDIANRIKEEELDQYLNEAFPKYWNQLIQNIDLSQFDEKISPLKNEAVYSELSEYIFSLLNEPFAKTPNLESMDNLQFFTIQNIIFKAIEEYLNKHDIDTKEEVKKALEKFIENEELENNPSQNYLMELTQTRNHVKNSYGIFSDYYKQRLEYYLTNLINFMRLKELFEKEVNDKQSGSEEI